MLAAVCLFLLLIVLYLVTAAGLGMLPTNRSFVETPNGVDIFIRADAVHSDILLPMQSVARNWHGVLNVPGEQNAAYLAFGWGDRAFYLETQTWGDLKASNAFKALFGLDTAVMHVTAEPLPRVDRYTIKVRVSEAQLQSLIAHVDAGFKRDQEGRPLRVPSVRYGDHDAFYEGVGHYSMFSTCNQWVRDGLAHAGVRTASWSPFAWSIVYQLKQNSR